MKKSITIGIAVLIVLLSQSCASIIPPKILYTEKGMEYHQKELIAKKIEKGLSKKEDKMLTALQGND